MQFSTLARRFHIKYDVGNIKWKCAVNCPKEARPTFTVLTIPFKQNKTVIQTLLTCSSRGKQRN